MKNKHLKKIAAYLANELSNVKSDSQEKIEPFMDEFAEYDSNVSEKAKKLLYSIFEHKEKLSISISDKYISLVSYDLSSLTKSSSNNKTKELYFGFEIIKNEGFIISYCYEKKTKYCDPSFYDDVIEELKEIAKTKNKESFDDIYNEVLITTGLNRKINLDDILN
jgi:predicted house-cleaning noncanonical NTP pyrophosphatase (MazG superfamily)